MPASGPLAACGEQRVDLFGVVSRFSSNTQSVSDALSTGARTAWPLSLPFSSG
jgi:hypothetical protein